MEEVTETIRLITARPELLVPLTVVVVLVVLVLLRRRRFGTQDPDVVPGRKRPFRPTRENPGRPDRDRSSSSSFRQEAGEYADEEDDMAKTATRRRALMKARIQIIMALISILGLTIIGIVNIL